MRNVLGLEDVVFFFVWNSPVTPGRNLLSEGLEHPYCTLMHSCQDSQPRKDSKK